MVNGMIHSMGPEQLLTLIDKFFPLIEPPIQDQTGAYDLMSRRMAVGLLPDIAGCLGPQIVQYADRVINLLFFVLEGELPMEVKTIAISAIGEICLNIESDFMPYFNKSMEMLVLAGQSSMELTSQIAVAEDRRIIHDMRQATIDSFLCIINGVKSTEVAMTAEQHYEILT
mmetsp:Transcript_36272/g.55713  ORF Transcript_36272/g.55713 Transcript_36272/m.55713 type:complete len:171 (+) Transcript_36272:1292-1804(+)